MKGVEGAARVAGLSVLPASATLPLHTVRTNIWWLAGVSAIALGVMIAATAPVRAQQVGATGGAGGMAPDGHGGRGGDAGRSGADGTGIVPGDGGDAGSAPVLMAAPEFTAPPAAEAAAAADTAT